MTESDAERCERLERRALDLTARAEAFERLDAEHEDICERGERLSVHGLMLFAFSLGASVAPLAGGWSCLVTWPAMIVGAFVFFRSRRLLRRARSVRAERGKLIG
jgi:Flp pilus assembly protein TadB